MTRQLAEIFSLREKNIWVFGGAGHLGRAVVSLLSALEAKVLCVDLADRAQMFVDAANLSPRVCAASLDIGDNAALKEFVGRAMASFDVPHGLVNLTYASTAKALSELTGEDFDRVNHAGLTAAFLLARSVGSEMANLRRGSMILFSSMYGSVAPEPNLYQAPMNPNPVEYGVTKAGIVQMARYFAVHWGRDNVRCNCISPGPFPNPTVQQDHPEFVGRLAARSPLGRIGQPEEIAGAVAFLLSDAASYITGHNLMVEGGWTAW